jgi:zinc transport system substrate-binding protein
MKKIIAILVIIAVLALSLFLFVSCNEEPIVEPTEPSLRIITTIFPQYDFVRQIAGDKVELTMLISPGAESHAFEPTPRDIIALNDADLFIYVGGHSDEWVEGILMTLEREDELRTVALVDLVEIVMTDYHDYDHDDHDHSHDHSHDHGHSHDHDDHDDHDHELHLDEHVWTSPRNAIVIAQALTEVLAELDPDNAEYFRANAAAYIAELQALDQEFAQVVSTAARSTVVFGDRFPFRYFTDAYGLTYYAAFTGCSSETQASPATIAFLIEKVRDENIPVVFYIEFSNRAIANTIAEATGARLLELHSAHNVSNADFNAGLTYIDIMRRNMENLREALN